MAYENKSMVYAMYDAAPMDMIARAFDTDPPAIVVADKHLQTSLLENIHPTIKADYASIYDDEYVTVYALKTRPALSPQKAR